MGCLFQQRASWRFAGATAACFALFMLAWSAGCDSPALLRLMEAQRLAGGLRVEFAQAAQVSNLAVMADSDEAAARYAREASERTKAVERSIDTLTPLLRELDYPDEAALLKDFSAKFAEYRKLDQSVLELALGGTNLKAQRLSFGAAMQAAQGFDATLAQVARGAPDNLRFQAQALTSAAVAALRQIQVLEAPHIASPDDAAMTELENQMTAFEAETRRALEGLTALKLPGAEAGLRTAATQLDAFMAIHAQIVSLSRRNTNVRSLSLSLGQKRVLTAACEDSLQVLHKTLLTKRDSPATR